MLHCVNINWCSIIGVTILDMLCFTCVFYSFLFEICYAIYIEIFVQYIFINLFFIESLQASKIYNNGLANHFLNHISFTKCCGNISAIFKIKKS